MFVVHLYLYLSLSLYNLYIEYQYLNNYLIKKNFYFYFQKSWEWCEKEDINILLLATYLRKIFYLEIDPIPIVSIIKQILKAQCAYHNKNFVVFWYCNLKMKITRILNMKLTIFDNPDWLV